MAAKVRIGVDYSRLIRKMKDRKRAAELAEKTRVDVKIRATGDRSEGKNITILRTHMKEKRLKLGLNKRQRDALNKAVDVGLRNVPDDQRAVHQTADVVAGMLEHAHRSNIDRDLRRHTGNTEASVYTTVKYGR